MASVMLSKKYLNYFGGFGFGDFRFVFQRGDKLKFVHGSSLPSMHGHCNPLQCSLYKMELFKKSSSYPAGWQFTGIRVWGLYAGWSAPAPRPRH